MTTDDPAGLDYSTAVHETGHMFAYRHFGIESVAVVFAPADRPVDPASGGSVAGVCRKSPYRPATPYQSAVVGWCGVLAELLVGVPHPALTIPYPLCAKNLRVIHDAIIVDCGLLSVSDQRLIAGFPSHWRTFKAAFHLLRRKKAELIRLATLKVKPTSTPVPENPMTEKQSQTTPLPFAGRIRFVENLLASLLPDDPNRPGWQTVLECYRRGEEPPAELLPRPAQPAVA